MKAFTDEAQKELDVLQRAAVLNSMFGGRRLVVEPEPEAQDSREMGERKLWNNT